MDKAQVMMMQGPIPGHSLTDEPGSSPWEQPPQINDPEDVLDHYLAKMADPEITDNLLTMIDLGMPISAVSDSLLSQGVMNGIHSVDAKMIVKPQVAYAMRDMAEAAGISYKMTLDDYRDKDAEAKMKRMKKLAAKLQVRKDRGAMDAGDVLQQQVAEEAVETPDFEQAETQQYEQQEAKAGGLMARE